MQIVYERCAGLDLHKKSVVACVITPDAHGQRWKEHRTFSSMTPDLLRLRDWLESLGVTHVAMESTGVFWRPIFPGLEGSFDLLVVNAQHIKAVRGAQDGCPRCRVDRRSLAARATPPQFHPASVATGDPRSHPLPHEPD